MQAWERRPATQQVWQQGVRPTLIISALALVAQPARLQPPRKPALGQLRLTAVLLLLLQRAPLLAYQVCPLATN